MDAPPLPDDPRNWPTDPFALLGVPRSVSEADLKRAYTRLIRKYKPEHAPEEFRRIREAYEAAIEMSRWYRDAPPVRETFGDLPFTPVSPSAPESTNRSPEQPPHETQIDPSVQPVSHDPVELAWTDAISGHWNDAYSALVSLADAHPHRADLPLRLYWLLALRPTLDATRTRHDWLATALARARLSGPAVELYRRELAVDPSVALYGPYVKLLELPDVDGRNLLAVANARLAAAAQDGRWALLELDLEALAARANAFPDAEWLRYVADLAGRAAGDRPPLVDRCYTLLTGLRHLHLSHGWAFDRLEHRQGMLTNLRMARIPEPVRRALAAAESGRDVKKSLSDVIEWAAHNPFVALRTYDVGMASPAGRPFLMAFGQLLANHSEPPGEYPQDLLRHLVRKGLSRLPLRDYIRARGPLMQFLLAEQIDPDELIAVCNDDPATNNSDLFQRVQTDESLRLVYRTVNAVL